MRVAALLLAAAALLASTAALPGRRPPGTCCCCNLATGRVECIPAATCRCPAVECPDKARRAPPVLDIGAGETESATGLWRTGGSNSNEVR